MLGVWSEPRGNFNNFLEMDALKALKAEAERKRKALDDQGLKVRQHVMTF